MKLKKKLNKIHYKNQKNWPEAAVFLFFSSVEPHIVLVLFLHFCFKFRLSYSIWKIYWPVVEITPHLVDKLPFDIYLLITVHFSFPNLDKIVFVLISALLVHILFLFSSKSHCSFEMFLIKKSVLSFVRYLLSISVRLFPIPSFDLYLLDYLG